MTVLYEQHFETPCTAAGFAETYPDLATWFQDFGWQPSAARVLSTAQSLTARAFPGTMNVQVDRAYWPGAAGPKVLNDACYLYAQAFGADAKTYGDEGTRPYACNLLSPKMTFSPGVRVAVKMLLESAAVPLWPAVWLFGGGPEFDFMEAYPAIGRHPFSTLHPATGKTAGSNGPSGHAVDWSKPHTFGGVWTTDYFSSEIDGQEVWRIANPGLVAPMHLYVDMDIAALSGGAPKASQLPAYIAVDSIVVTSLS